LDNHAFYQRSFCLCLFASYICGSFALGRYSPRYAATWLFLASVVFYGYWMPEFTLLLIVSVCFNFWVGSHISRLMSSINDKKQNARRWLICGITVNLALLGYFKHANFLALPDFVG